MRVSQMKETGAVEARAWVCLVHISVDRVKLRVIEEVEVLPTEVDGFGLTEGEALEKTEVKVQAAGQIERIAADIAKRESRGYRESRRVVKDRSSHVGEVGLREAGMRIADQIGARASAHTVGYAGGIAILGAIPHTERRTGLSNRDAGDLPTAEYVVLQPRSLVDGQGINVAEGHIVAHVKIGTSPILGDVIRIHESAVIAIRGVINGVAVGVGKAHGEITNRTQRRSLKGVVYGVCLIFQPGDASVTKKRTQRVWIITAGHAEVRGGLAGNWFTVGERARRGQTVAVGVGDGLSLGERIRRRIHRLQLVEVTLQGQVCSFGSHVGTCDHNVPWQVPLHIEVPLLHVRPNGLIRYGVDAEGEERDESSTAANVRITVYIKLRRVQCVWGGAFEGLRVGFIAVGVLKENAVAATNGHFAITLGIESEANSRSRVEQMAFEAARVGARAHGAIGIRTVYKE